ncbi:MAG: metallophosphoesterase [Bacteroidaceae bacterium]|nr:metallophosphoesterase [Bacteroidaceae bacterium]
MKRREFLRSSAIIAAATGTGSVLPQNVKAAPTPEQTGTENPRRAAGSLITSAPMLQNYAATSMGIAFCVSDMANGFVLYSEDSNMSDAKKVKCGGFRVTDMNDKVMLIRLTKLKPATTYYYQIGADHIQYKGGYNMKVLSTEMDDRIYKFTTAGEDAVAHFCVINDTHVKWPTITAAIEKIAQLQPSCVIWNGDASNTEESIEALQTMFLKPEIDRKDYAAETPYLFCPGNHDQRGMGNRHLERVWMFRQPEERSARDWDLGRNFAVRMGEIALIGLDTGEDKLDDDTRFAGLFNNEAYRVAQTDWLADALQQPEIASAPFIVAFCHIPLYDTRENANPGDVPQDQDDAYSNDYAAWQRTCAQMWTPLLEKAGCQLIITAHQHRYRYDKADSKRSWAHIVGGGPDMASSTGFPTVIEGKVKSGRMLITVYNVAANTIKSMFVFNSKATAVESVSMEPQNAPEGWYTLDGRKLDTMPTTPGIYVCNGRKVAIK